MTSQPRLALVTGASSGIGLSLAKQFAANHFDLVICSETDAIERAAGELRTLGIDVTSVQADLASFDGVEKLYARVTALGRPLYAAALNAGIGSGGAFAEQSLEDELEVISLNITSTVHLAKRLLPDMIARHEGRLLFTASIAATMPGAYSAVYNGTKAFVLQFAEAIRTELKDTGVTVTALMPGATETNFFHRANMDDTRVGSGQKDDPDLVAKQGFEALMAGKDSIVAGSLKTKVIGAVNEVLPESVKSEQHAKLAKPGGARDRA